MKKIFSPLASLSLFFVMLFSLGSCSKSGDMEALLKTVPADAYFVATFNVDEILNQLDYKDDGDHATYCKELQDLLKTAGFAKNDIHKVTDGIDLSNRTLALFAIGEDMYATFSVKDAKNFRKWLEKAADTEMTDEGEGFYSANGGHMIMKDNQVWASSRKLSATDVQKMLDLKDEDRFSEKCPETVAAMCKADNTCCMFLDIDAGLSQLRKLGAIEQVAQIQLALGVAFKDASYVTAVGTLYSDRTEGVLTVLNSKEQPAEFNIPMGKINTSAMNKINNDAFIVAAVDFSPEFIKMMSGLVEKYSSSMSAANRMMLSMLMDLSGTSSLSFDGQQRVLASIGFKDEQSAEAFGRELGTLSMPASMSTAGKFLILRMGDDTKAGGNAPEAFKDQFFGYYVNFDSKNVKDVKDAMPYNMSGLGSCSVVIGPNGKGVQLKSVWRVKDPVKTSLKMFAEVLPQLGNIVGGRGSYNPEPVIEIESSVEENTQPAAAVPDPAFEPEPDSDEVDEIGW